MRLLGSHSLFTNARNNFGNLTEYSRRDLNRQRLANLGVAFAHDEGITGGGPGKKTTIHERLNLFDSSLPREAAKAIPLDWYKDLEIYKAECQVFRQNWIAVGRTGEVDTLRSYFQLNIAEEPVLVLRDTNNALQAFSNVCRHRATLLLTDAHGTLPGERVKCRYHGWEYDLSGCLRRAPELGKVNDFSPAENGLPRFETATWGPLVFLHMQPGADSLPSTLEPLIQRTKDIDLSSLQWGGRTEYEVACNWKVYVDNYLDGGYHVKEVHPKLAEVLDDENYQTEVFERSSLQHSPIKATGDPSATVRQGSEAMYWWIFPNVMINIYKGVMDTNIVIPLGPDKCKVIFDFYFDKEWKPSDIKTYIEGAHQVQLEDMEVCEDVQKGLKSHFSKSGPYAKREEGELHFHKLLAQQLKAVTAV